MTDEAESEPAPAQAELDRLLRKIDEAALQGENGDSAPANLANVLLSERYRGTFPHPATLRELDEVVKDGAERAFSLTEREQAHRHKIDEKMTDLEIEVSRAELRDRRLIIWITFVVIIAGLGASFGLALAGLALGAGVVGGATTALAGLGGVATYRRKRKEEDKSAK